jgi:LPXTG-site transpeptidase (sortase) family protein
LSRRPLPIFIAIAVVLLVVASSCIRSVEREPVADDAPDDHIAERSAPPACTFPNGAYEPESTDEIATPGKPTRLLIATIDVDAPIEYVGLDNEGHMEVPQEWDNVAWFEPGPIPGEPGNAVMAGHYDSATGPAVFYELDELEIGDEIIVLTQGNEELVFEIIEIEDLHVDDIDTSKIFGDTEDRNLNLVTCSGDWDTSFDMYDRRLIVYTRLING